MITKIEISTAPSDLAILQLETPGLGDNSYVLRSGDEVAATVTRRAAAPSRARRSRGRSSEGRSRMRNTMRPACSVMGLAGEA